MARVDYFQDIYYRNQGGFVSFNDKHLQRRRKFVTERDFPILDSYTWSGLMSESQQGPEICDVISRKRYLQYGILRHWRSLNNSIVIQLLPQRLTLS